MARKIKILPTPEQIKQEEYEKQCVIKNQEMIKKQQLSRNPQKMAELMEGRYKKSELDQKLNQMIDQGKTDKEIINDLINIPKNKKKQKYQIKDKEMIRQNNLNLIKLLNADSLKLSKLTREKSEISKEDIENIQLNTDDHMNKHMRSIIKEQEQEFLIDEMKEKSQLKQLKYEPIKIMYGTNKMTKAQKQFEQKNMAIIQSDIYEKQEMPPKEYLQRQEYEERVYEYFTEEQVTQYNRELEKKKQTKEKDINKNTYDEQKSKMVQQSKQQKLDELILKKFKTQQQHDFSSKFNQLAKSDQKDADKSLDNYIEEAKVGDRFLTQIVRNQNDENIVFQKKEKLNNLFLQSFDMEEETNIQLRDEILQFDFQTSLKNLQENEKFKRNLEKRLRKQKIKQIYKAIEERDYNQDIDYDQDIPKVNLKVKQDKNIGGVLPDQEQLEKVEYMERLRELDDNKMYQHHHIRTTRNYKKFFEMYVFNKNKTAFKGVIFNQDIFLKTVITNNALTICYVFWEFSDIAQKNMIATSHDPEINRVMLQEFEKLKHQNQMNVPKIQKNFRKYSKMIRGMMCQKLGLKYAPEVRFIKSERQDKLQEIIDDFRKEIPNIVKANLKEEYQKQKQIDPNYKQYINNQQFNDICNDEITEFIANMTEQLDHQDQLREMKLSSKKPQYDKNGMKIRNNRNKDGSKKKFKRKDRFERFWETLD